MQIVTILNNQSLIDIAIQHTGSIENCFPIALANGLSITDYLTAGSKILIPELSINEEIKTYYDSKQIKPATGFSESDGGENELEGISIWILNKNFVVQ